jgi:hypothetical protein
MREALNPLLQVLRLQRSGFTWIDFNDRATGDALVFVIIARFLMFLGFGGSFLGVVTNRAWLEVLLFSLFNALVFWLAYAGIVLVVVRSLFQASGNYAFFLRLTGFAYPTMLLTVFTFRLGLEPVLALLVGSVWLLAIVTQGVRYETDLPAERAVVAAVLGLAGWVIVALILRRGLI